MGGRPGVSSGGMDGNLTNRGRGFSAAARQKARTNRAARLDGAEIARKLTSGDKKYMTNLRKRLRAGSAGPIENLLWMLAHGKPKEQMPDDDVAARLVEVREAAKAAIRAAQPRRELPPHIVEVTAEPVKGPGDDHT